MECCQESVIHLDIVKKFENIDWNIIGIKKMGMIFKLISDETRLKILYLLFFERMCVCDISYVLNMSQSAISHQLRGLRQEMIVESEKVGKVVYYFLNKKHEFIEILEKLFEI